MYVLGLPLPWWGKDYYVIIRTHGQVHVGCWSQRFFFASCPDIVVPQLSTALMHAVFPLFYALHAMQTRSSDENSVRLSVCPSVCLSVRLSVRHTRVLWKNGRKICPDLYTIRKIIYASLLRRRMVGGGRPLLPEILGQPTFVGAKSPILNR